jgi:hypothetical protein
MRNNSGLFSIFIVNFSDLSGVGIISLQTKENGIKKKKYTKQMFPHRFICRYCEIVCRAETAEKYLMETPREPLKTP